tara:strand:+ start:68179 stop:68613 length:435 start_codon:yes stop_codon:yes gene_type:complete
MAPNVANAERERGPHLVLQTGLYAAAGSPAPWGPSIALDVLPGSVFERWGIRGEYRGYRGFEKGSVLVGALFEAGASRPQLALKLAVQAGLTDERAPIVGGGIDWSLWVLGPLGVSAVTDLTVIIDGSDTRPALSGVLSLHIGR